MNLGFNVFDLQGPAFLGFFVAALVLAYIVSVVLSHWCKRRHVAYEPTPDLSPIEVAYLAGGRARAIDAALVGLMHHDRIQVRTSGGGFLPGKGTWTPLTGLQSELFREINDGRDSIEKLRGLRTPTIARMESKLGREGLLLNNASGEGRCQMLARGLPMAAVIGLGVIKIGVGLQRNRPVVILVFLVLAALAWLVYRLVNAPHRTGHGDRALEQLRKRNAALEATTRRRAGDLDEASLMLAVGLFGTGVLAHSDVLWMQEGFVNRASRDGGSSCSSSGCGGGGGGGCGGCGG